MKFATLFLACLLCGATAKAQVYGANTNIVAPPNAAGCLSNNGVGGLSWQPVAGGGGGGSSFPLTGNANAANFSLTNLFSITFSNGVLTITTNGATNLANVPVIYNWGTNSTVSSSNVIASNMTSRGACTFDAGAVGSTFGGVLTLAGGSGQIIANGSGLVSLSASALSSGTVPTAQLPSALQTLVISNSFNGALTEMGNAVTTNGLLVISSYAPGSNYLLNLAPYSNVANLVIRFAPVTNLLQVTFTNAADGLSFLIQACQGASLTNGIWFNTNYASSNMNPCVNPVYGQQINTIPTTSTNSMLASVFTVFGTNVYLASQAPFAR